MRESVRAKTRSWNTSSGFVNHTFGKCQSARDDASQTPAPLLRKRKQRVVAAHLVARHYLSLRYFTNGSCRKLLLGRASFKLSPVFFGKICVRCRDSGTRCYAGRIISSATVHPELRCTPHLGRRLDVGLTIHLKSDIEDRNLSSEPRSCSPLTSAEMTFSEKLFHALLTL
jgi:hypothetical protein